MPECPNRAVAGAMRGWRAPTKQGSPDKRRARDRATHAETMAIVARVQERIRAGRTR